MSTEKMQTLELVFPNGDVIGLEGTAESNKDLINMVNGAGTSIKARVVNDETETTATAADLEAVNNLTALTTRLRTVLRAAAEAGLLDKQYAGLAIENFDIANRWLGKAILERRAS